MSNWLLRLATLYFAIGVAFGVAMGISHDFTQAPVHTHLNLLGWVSLGLIALLYGLRPEFAATRLARAHFVLHNLGLPLMCGGLFFQLRGEQAAVPAVGIGSLLLAAGVVCLLVNVWRLTRSATSAEFSHRPARIVAG